MVKTFSDFETKESTKDIEWLKFKENETKEIVLLSKIVPNEGESWNDTMMAWYSQYVPTYTRSGWKTEEGGFFFGYPELDEAVHNERFPEVPYVNVGEVLGLKRSEKFLLWVSETNGSEIVPVVYAPPSTVAKALADLERGVKTKLGKDSDLRGLPIVIKRDDTGKGATTYSVSHAFGGVKIPLDEILSIELPASLESFIKPATVTEQIEDALKNRELIEKITGKPLPFSSDGKLLASGEIELEL